MNWTTFFAKFGAMEQRSQTLARDVSEIKTDLKAMADKHAALQSFQDKQRGMWFAVATLSAIIGAVVTIIARYVGVFFGS